VKRVIAYRLAILASFIFSAAHAYEPSTHGVLSSKAAQSSVLVSMPILRDYGLDRSIEDESQKFRNFAGDRLTILDLIVEGSQLEDTLTNGRPRNHFYNPRTGLPLTWLGASLGATSPDWALAPRGSNSDQERSYWDARQHLFDALTKPSVSERDQGFGRTFQALGHVLHHLQDMAQPQHVRNEIHCDILPCLLVQPLLGNPSRYERYTQQRERSLPTDPARTGYDVSSPVFVSAINSPRRFWNTQPWGPASPESGQGIAEFTHRNFVTAGTNFLSTGAGSFLSRPAFPLPVPSTPQITERPNIESLIAGTPLRGEMWFIGSEVRDNLTGQTTLNRRASTFSVFTEDLRARTGLPTVTLNRFNFESAHEFLIPRAVAYSAGMINYFFRGQLDFRKDDQDPAKFRIVNLGPEAMSGRFALYYDAKDGNRYPVAVDPADINRDPNGQNAWRLTIAALDRAIANSNLSEKISFLAPPNDGSPQSPKVVNEYMLVFSGSMGEEREDKDNGIIGAVAAKALKADINGTLYVKVQRNNLAQAVLKVDKSGTRYLQPGEFNPLESYDPNGGILNRSHWQAAGYKQVEFKPLVFGGYDYTVLSFNIPNVFLGHAAYVRDTSGNFARRQRPIAWLARNTTFGDFEFSLPNIYFEGGSTLQYTRRFTEDGQARTEQGAVSWPSFFAPPLENRAGGVNHQPAISADGLRISGFIEPLATVTSNVGGVSESRTDIVEHAVTLNPGAVPGAALQTGAPQPYRLSRSWTELSANQTNQSVGNFTRCDGTPGGAFQTESHLRFLGHAELLTRTLHGIGSINGAARFVEYSDEMKHRFGYDVIDNRYAIGCYNGIDNSIRYQGSADSEDLGVIRTSIVAPATRAEATQNSVNAALSRPFGFGHATRPAYDVINVGPPPFIPKPVPRGRSLSLIKALGENARDAFYQEVDYDAGTSPMKFREEVTDFNSVADVSPVGEIFFASQDGSTLVHEPLQGGMPKIVLPPDVIRILGALWL